MSHYPVLVLTVPGGKSLHALLAPYDENGQNPDVGRWDWYDCAGGRFTGMFTDYDPRLDPLNYVVCDLCGGTGTRPDMDCQTGLPKPDPAKVKRFRVAGYKVVPMTTAREKDLRPRIDTSFETFPVFMAVDGKGAWTPFTTGCNGCRGTGASRNWNNRPLPQENTLPVARVLAANGNEVEKITLAVVTPDGKWHERGRMGMFAAWRNDPKSVKDWRREWRNILRRHEDATATLVDCHV